MKKQLNSFPLYNNSLVVGPDINHVRDCIKKRKKNKVEKKLSIYSSKYWIPGANKLIKTVNQKLFGNSVRIRHTCKAFKYLNNVVKYSRNSLNALTWHQYYLNGHTCTQNDFLNVTVLENLRSEMLELSKFLSKKNIKLPMWLGETSSAYGGGAPGLSDRYIAGFLWLDKLGLVASLNKNYKVIVRQTFYHGHYALIGTDLQPNPDYWISLLHKTLVSENVIKIRLSRMSKNQKLLRLYAHCAAGLRHSVTLFGLNLSDKSNTFKIHSSSRSNFNIKEVHHYILNADKEKLTSRSINLNGRPLEILKNDSLPNVVPVVTYESPNRFTVPAYGMGFWVFINSTTNIC
jgi:heparanase 1